MSGNARKQKELGNAKMDSLSEDILSCLVSQVEDEYEQVYW